MRLVNVIEQALAANAPLQNEDREFFVEIVLTAANDTNQRRQALRDLQNDTLVTSTKVTYMVQERQLAYKLTLHTRQQQLETYLLSATMEQLQSNVD